MEQLIKLKFLVQQVELKWLTLNKRKRWFIVAVDFLIHVVFRILSSHHHRFARRDSIRQSDVQIGMTIVRYPIHCLASKNDAVIIVIEDDCDATMFRCSGFSQIVSPIAVLQECVRRDSSREEPHCLAHKKLPV